MFVDDGAGVWDGSFDITNTSKSVWIHSDFPFAWMDPVLWLLRVDDWDRILEAWAACKAMWILVNGAV